MPVIRTHDITLCGGSDTHNIVLRPLSDEYLPLLYKWNADLEVLYWTEGEDVQDPYSKEMVHLIYGGVSQSAFCFLIEVDDIPIGECWLQEMNVPSVTDLYPARTDVRRIDLLIGEKNYWGRGIGTKVVRMLVDFAFAGEQVDVLHCFCADYNCRSQRVWEKNGFSLIRKVKQTANPKMQYEYHYVLTRQQYLQTRRTTIPKERIFMLPIADLQPSQLYISQGKLRLAEEWFDKSDVLAMDPIPIKDFNGKKLMTDGHTRAVLAYLNGFAEVPCYWDTDELDMDAYAKYLAWCADEGVVSVADLAGRIVSFKEYEVLWRKRCMLGK